MTGARARHAQTDDPRQSDLFCGADQHTKENYRNFNLRRHAITPANTMLIDLPFPDRYVFVPPGRESVYFKPPNTTPTRRTPAEASDPSHQMRSPCFKSTSTSLPSATCPPYAETSKTGWLYRSLRRGCSSDAAAEPAPV